jgi:hypothetical protein
MFNLSIEGRLHFDGRDLYGAGIYPMQSGEMLKAM